MLQPGQLLLGIPGTGQRKTQGHKFKEETNRRGQPVSARQPALPITMSHCGCGCPPATALARPGPACRGGRAAEPGSGMQGRWIRNQRQGKKTCTKVPHLPVTYHLPINAMCAMCATWIHLDPPRSAQPTRIHLDPHRSTHLDPPKDPPGTHQVHLVCGDLLPHMLHH